MVERDEVAGLLRKYQEIMRLRREAEATPAVDPRRAMAALATEFPGALREADELPMAELERRVGELVLTLETERSPAAWMTAMARFHALTRGALSAKKWLAGRRYVDDRTLEAFELEAASLRHPDEARAWVDGLGHLASPPRGKVTDVIFTRLGHELGLEPDRVRRIVFGDPRGAPARALD